MRRCLLLLLVPALSACSVPAPLRYQPGPDNRPAQPELSQPSQPEPSVPGCVRGTRFTAGEGSAAMGLRAVGIEVHNCGSTAFDVDGYPVVEVLGVDRKALGVRTLQGVEEVSPIEQWMVAPERVTVPPGKSARALLVWRSVTTGEASTGAFVRLAAGEGKPSQVLELTVDTGSTGRVAVSPWIAA